MLAVAAQSGEGHRIEARLSDLKSASFAHTIPQLRDSLECIVDLSDLELLARRQLRAHLALILFGSKIGTVHTIVPVAFPLTAGFRVDFLDQSDFHADQMFAHFGKKLTAARCLHFFDHRPGTRAWLWRGNRSSRIPKRTSRHWFFGRHNWHVASRTIRLRTGFVVSYARCWTRWKRKPAIPGTTEQFPLIGFRPQSRTLWSALANRTVRNS